MHSVVLGKDGMTIDEAINYITYHGFISDDVKDMAIAALEKQIPKKANKNIMGVCCPVCRNLLDGTERFCLYCGQHIDWSEEE